MPPDDAASGGELGPGLDDDDAGGATTIPEVAQGLWHRLDPRWVDAERVGWWILLGVLVPAGAIGAGLAFGVPGWWWVAVGIAAVLVTVGGVRAGMVLTRAQFARARWLVDERALVLRRGVFWRKIVNVPRSRIQHTDITQGPVERRFGLATLVVHTAGTNYATVSQEGLTHATALAVRDHLLEGTLDDGV